MSKPILETALEYLLKYKFSVVPQKPDKGGTYIYWKEFQGRLPTEDEVKEWFTKWPEAMIGVVTGPISDLIAVDIDLYKLKEDARAKIYDLIPHTITGPISLSPEGGHHRLFRYPENGTVLNSATDVLPGLDIKALKGLVTMPPSINKDGNPHQWVIHESLQERALSSLNINIIKSFNMLINKGSVTPISPNHNQPFQTISKHNIILDDGRRGETMFHVANSLIRGGMKRENVYEVLRIIANNCNPPFEEKEIPARINSAIGRLSDKAESITNDIKEFVSISNGYFSISNVAESISNHNKAQIRTVLHRLSKPGGIVERDSKRDGWYRRIDNEIEETEWKNINIEDLPIKYPFRIHTLFKTMPKNIIVVSGTSDAGKTAFLLNFIDKNMKLYRNKIHYFSSEMGPMELKSRVEKFGFDLKLWNFKFYERGDNFADVIKPDEINIIDYLDITDEFYKVGLYIKQIFDKLNKGIAIIALQKNPEKDHGLGGMRSVEKARLYVSIDPGRMKIVKCKNWATEVNPNGLYMNFKLVGGCKIMEDVKGWQKDVKDNKTVYIEES